MRAYTPKELAAAWRVNYRTILDLIADGSLEAFRVGSTYRITESAAERYVRESTTGKAVIPNLGKVKLL